MNADRSPEDGATLTAIRERVDVALYNGLHPRGDDLESLLNALETVEAIHQPSTCYDSCSYPHDCRACLVEWPCPTALAVGAVVREVSDDRA